MAKPAVEQEHLAAQKLSSRAGARVTAQSVASIPPAVPVDQFGQMVRPALNTVKQNFVTAVNNFQPKPADTAKQLAARDAARKALALISREEKYMKAIEDGHFASPHYGVSLTAPEASCLEELKVALRGVTAEEACLPPELGVAAMVYERELGRIVRMDAEDNAPPPADRPKQVRAKKNNFDAQPQEGGSE